MRKTRFVIGTSIGLCLLLLAPMAAGQAEGHGPSTDTTFDAILARVGSAVPSFAGFALQDNSRFSASLTILATASDPAVIGRVRRELARDFGDELRRVAVRLKQVPFTFVQLKTWADEIRSYVLGLDGVVHFDIDEARNRLSIGVESAAATRTRIREVATNRGIPLEAIAIEEVPPVTQELRQRRRPFLGGLQIEWLNYDDGFVYICSLGFNAVRLGTQGFVTNSHCSTTQGEVDVEDYFQADWGFFATDEIGYETVDPQLVTGSANSCPSGRRCRWSDANFSIPWCAGGDLCGAVPRHGFIARVPIGSFTWNGTDTYRITSSGFPTAATIVQKVGRTTGRTSGSVLRTCVDVNVAGTNITMKCQAQAEYASAGGDSGSPVFRITNSPSGSDVQLVGIHWGSGGTFSPLPNLRLAGELGTGSTSSLTVCAAGFSC